MTAVAGVSAPAFVERVGRWSASSATMSDLSPGFRPRPSLSEVGARLLLGLLHLSPGFRPRPSLSGQDAGGVHQGGRGAVAGVSAPAFVERTPVAADDDRTGHLCR